jgi:ribulose 1,5-bisphosphate carboxylase large subunit-like protein
MPINKEKYVQIAYTLRLPMVGIRTVMPMTGGAMHPGMVKPVMDNLGVDVILGAGGGISAHPMGPRLGAKAMRQAVDAALAGQDIVSQAEQHAELAAALRLWGVVSGDERATQRLR